MLPLILRRFMKQILPLRFLLSMGSLKATALSLYLELL